MVHVMVVINLISADLLQRKGAIHCSICTVYCEVQDCCIMYTKEFIDKYII